MSSESNEQVPESDVEASPEQVTEESEIDIQAVLDEAMKQAAVETIPLSNDEQVAEAQRAALQAKAELENFRKRMQRDSELQLKYANMPIVRDMLDIVDNLNRANQAAQGESASGLKEGVEMVSKQLAGILDKYGCRAIESLGQEFDPNFHEAISQIPSEEYESGVVAQEVAVGYRLFDRVVRPSSVMVSTGAPAAE